MSDLDRAAAVGTNKLDPMRNTNLIPVGLVGPLSAGKEVTDAIGQRWKPKLTPDGNPIIRATKPGDLFLANSKTVRICECTSRQFKGLVRQIVEVIE